MTYFDELTKSMTLLGEDDRTIFLGQGVCYEGHAIFRSLEGVPMRKRIEMPVAEDMQMGISIGLALEGYIPISIYPRMDFLLLAMNQLVNHLDKINKMSHGEFTPKVIIRTMIGSREPLDGGIQHTQDYTEGLRSMLDSVIVAKFSHPEQIVPNYKLALNDDNSYIFVEHASLYEEA